MPRLLSRVIALVATILIAFSVLAILKRNTASAADPFRVQDAGSIHYGQDFGDHDSGDEYLLGLGKGDITGPVVEINFMGYADPGQLGTGLRQRLYSRAFIVGDPKKPAERIVYIVLDAHAGDTAVRYGILEALKELGPEYAVYGQHNVALTGTHSHSGPGAWNNYLLPQITSKGFHKPSYQALVDGAVQSIRQAHDRLALGRLSVGSIDVQNANINRSPHAYLANPKEERARYKDDVDKTMTVLRFTQTTDAGEKDIGMFTWFATHGTSMQANNTLVTGDNKGVAAYLFEKYVGDDSFVGGFSQANLGDTSPNVLGGYCEYGEQEGQKCDYETSLCGGKSNPCHARGPFYGRDDTGLASTYEIGIRQFEGARKLFEHPRAFAPVKGSVVKGLHQFVDLSNFQFTLPNGTDVRTCPAALGWSFAAGTIDWPGSFDFKQGQPHEPNANPLWALFTNRIHKPNSTQRACHREKPILLNVGESDSPYAWSPNIIDIQTLRIGNFFIIVSPGEATTMAGRRWREALQRAASSTFPEIRKAGQKPVVVLGGPADTYAHYITTPEEYTKQRFEGASTLYGPYTLDAYIDRTLALLPYLGSSTLGLPSLDRGPQPPITINDSLSFITPVVMDRPPIFKSFGDVAQDVKPTYQAGETVSASFVGANPRNNLRLGGTFAAMEKLNEASSTWEIVRTDDDWDLTFEWKRTSTALGTSQVTISWETMWDTGDWRKGGAADDEVDGPIGELRRRSVSDLHGKYRFRYFGDAKAFRGATKPFEGMSGVFSIT